ncbi:MAG: PQQ-dependent sugar dehydrogenase [Alphaproteobacteria bacterium]|nr:PQQ-dependent sugar dehydrogenase [Alphaproteobacteria bacterium]
MHLRPPFLVFLAFAAGSALLPVLAQSAHPEPGASFGDDYAPRPAFPEQTRAKGPQTPSAVKTEVIAGNLDHPWSLAFLPDGSFLITERAGHLRIVSTAGEVSEPIDGLPPIKAAGTKGLHDVVLDPAFAQNRRIYFSYFAPNDANPTPDTEAALEAWLKLPVATREAHKIGFETIGRAELSSDGKRLEHFQIILQAPAMGARRLVFGRDGKLLVAADTPGAGDLPTDNEPQKLNNLYGKVLRINSNGTVPRDNPFYGRKGVRGEIYAYGFRDPEGAALDPATGDLWTTENGPRGGDELNHVRAGRNYGFPTISYGLDYQGRLLGTGKLKAKGMEQPVYFWTPSMATSGLTFYDGALFPEWRGDLFLGALAAKRLIRLHLVGGKVITEEHLLMDRGKRVRDVRQGPDGALYVLTDEKPGELLRLVPAAATREIARQE